MPNAARPESGWLHRRSVEMMGAGVSFLAGAALGLMSRSEQRPRAGLREREPAGGVVQALPPAEEPVVYEFSAQVVWSDKLGRVTSDLEDAESIESFLNQGWELINVIVPFAQTTQLEISYPGNTRKLIAYFRRPIEGCIR